MDIITHHAIDRELCGTPVMVEDGTSIVEMTATKRMAADERGLVHGGFIFGLADYAAMIAVNHPNVVLGGAEIKFLKPVKTGEAVRAEANLISEKGKKKIVAVEVRRGSEIVFQGEFICFILDQHVLDA